MTSFIVPLTLNFIAAIPPDTNAYLATVAFLKALTQPPPVSGWARWLNRGVTILAVLMLCQATRRLYFRIRTRRLRFFGLNTLGLVKVDFQNVACVACMLFGALTIADRIFRELVVAGYHDQSGQIFLFGIKFSVLHSVACFLLWACVCQFVLFRFKTNQGDPTRVRTPVARMMSWILNGLFVIAALWHIGPICWAFFNANAQYIEVTKMFKPINENLLHMASSFSPEAYNQWHLISMITPLTDVIPHVDGICHYVRMGIRFYLIVVIMLSLMYLPCAVHAIMGLCDRQRVKNMTLEPQTRHSTRIEITSSTRSFGALKKHQELIDWLVLLIYAIILGYIPVLIWMLSFRTPNFVLESGWWAGAEIGLHMPSLILGNLCLFLITQVDFEAGPKQLQEGPVYPLPVKSSEAWAT